LGFNGTFSTTRLYHAFEQYAGVKELKLMKKLKNREKLLKYLFNLVFVEETLQQE